LIADKKKLARLLMPASPKRTSPRCSTTFISGRRLRGSKDTTVIAPDGALVELVVLFDWTATAVREDSTLYHPWGRPLDGRVRVRRGGGG